MNEPTPTSPPPTAEPTTPASNVLASAPPRAVTPAVRRQSRREIAVRRWLLVAACVGLVAVSVGWRNVRDGLADRALRRNGVRVIALIEGIGGGTDRNVDRNSARPVILSVQIPGEAERRTIHGNSSPQPGRFSLREEIPIWINPTNVSEWTDRAEQTPWLSLLAVPLLLAPLVVALTLMAARRGRRYVAIYRDGGLARGTVAEVQTSALAPGQKVLRVALPDRTVTVAHPNRLGPVARGDAVEVIVDPGGDAVLARAYA